MRSLLRLRSVEFARWQHYASTALFLGIDIKQCYMHGWCSLSLSQNFSMTVTRTVPTLLVGWYAISCTLLGASCDDASLDRSKPIPCASIRLEEKFGYVKYPVVDNDAVDTFIEQDNSQRKLTPGLEAPDFALGRLFVTSSLFFLLFMSPSLWSFTIVFLTFGIMQNCLT